MRVLILHSKYRSGSGSGENRVVEDEIHLLTSAGHRVSSWTPSADTSSPQRIVRAGLDAVWSRRAISRVRNLVRENKPDVVHVHNLFPNLSPAVITSVAAEGVPVVMTLHNYRLLCLPATLFRDGRPCELCLGKVPWRGVRYRCYRDSAGASAALAVSLTTHRVLSSFEKVARYLAVSSFLRNKHIQAGFDPRLVRVKRNFAWPTEPRQGAGDYFLFAGRVSEEKGIQGLVESWPQHGPELVIVGDGPLLKPLQSRSSNVLKFMGPRPPDELPDMLRRARALLVPSRTYEGMPRVILEAYAAGVPVLGTAAGAIPEVIRDGETGLLAEAPGSASWKAALERLNEDTESERLGAGALRLYEGSFTPEHGLRDLEAAYSSVLGGASPTSS